MNLDEKINDIYKKNGSSIIVTEGMDVSNLPITKKYFSFSIDHYDQIDLEEFKETVVEEILLNREFEDDFKWMTIEEFQLFKEQLTLNKMPIFVLKNNLYDKQFPYAGTLSDVESIFHNLYYMEDNELDSDQTQLLETVSFFYGRIDYSKPSNNYYVTYPELNDFDNKVLNIIPMYDFDELEIKLTDDYPLENIKQVELSEDELPFLDIIGNIVNQADDSNIVFVLSGSEIIQTNDYKSRIQILSHFTKSAFYFTTVSIRRGIIENEEKYLTLLRKYYKYANFRELQFYKNIEEHSNELIAISQAQIIDDIVNQAELAITGQSFRDIYITAPTGSGKSVMFQIPALYLSETYPDIKPLTLVISPLIGLMDDQVNSMKSKGVTNAATINGNTLPFQKEKILEDVQNNKIDLLYLSPETLQARSDIKMLIGERKIGVVIVDEAHIVTTWGKSFRADYWYLGIYLAKLRKQYKFPIVTFTATSIYGGPEDMYLDTRNSLNMISPISYFGNVRRDEILMQVRSSEKDFDKEGRDYRKTKNALALGHLIKAMKKHQKTLMYFPTIKLLSEFYSFVKLNAPEIAEKTGRYHGSLSKEEKDAVLNGFKSSEYQFVLATKAFGMGIDIPDITNVYHYAPTGSVVDYIQEIGRAARQHEIVPCGFGVIDFLPSDMNEVKKLYGMSSIRKNQIIEVMKKIILIYKEKGNNRNLIISPEDFKYIFSDGLVDENSLDNKVKTILLMIEKDFSSPNKIGYSPFVARPRSLFGNDLIFVTSELEDRFMKSRLTNFFSERYKINGSNYNAIYQVDLGGIWEKFYKEMSFPQFKYSLFNSEKRKNLKHNYLFEKFVFTSGIEVSIKDNNSHEHVISQYRKILNSFENFINQQKAIERQFTLNDLGVHFKQTLKISDTFEARAFAQTILNSSFEFSKLTSVRFISERPNTPVGKEKYIIHQDGEVFTKFILSELNDILNPSTNYLEADGKTISFYRRSKNDDRVDSRIAALGIGEAREMLNYQIIGGNNPQLYLRINSIYPMEKAIRKPEFYQNLILKDVQTKHYTSVEMLNYLFTKEQPERTAKEKIINYSKWFWDTIEDYFMGKLPVKVEENLNNR